MQLSYLIVLAVILVLLLIALLAQLIRNVSGNKTVPRERPFVLNDEAFVVNCAGFGLSLREIEVLRLILSGYSYKETGERLFISEKTVDSHVQHIYAKVGVRNKLALLNKLYA